MTRPILIVLLLTLAVPCLAFGQATPHPATRPTNAPQAQTAKPVRAVGESPGGYVKIDGGPETMCSQGTPYAFYFRSGRPDRVTYRLRWWRRALDDDNWRLDREADLQPNGWLRD